jgi:hypothetical protein
MKRLAYICCIISIPVFVTHCENKHTSHDSGNTMNSTNPDYTLVMSAFDKTNEQIREKGWENIGVEHRHLANVIGFYSKVENSGFSGFYFDSEYLPDMLEELSRSLKEVGALRAEGLLQASTLKFEGGIVPAGMDARIEVAQSYPEDFDPFEDLDNKFYREAEPDMALLANYIRSNPSAFK